MLDNNNKLYKSQNNLKTMRKIIPTFTSLVLLSGCALYKSHTFENRIKNSSIRPVVYSEKLKLNSANEVMFYSRISQTKGTREFF